MDSITIGSMKVNGVTRGGIVGLGSMLLFGLRNLDKSNSGNGSITGDYGTVPTDISLIMDPDVIDSPLWAPVNRTG